MYQFSEEGGGGMTWGRGGWGWVGVNDRDSEGTAFFSATECHSCHVMKIRNGFIVQKHESRQSSTQDDETQKLEEQKVQIQSFTPQINQDPQAVSSVGTKVDIY